MRVTRRWKTPAPGWLFLVVGGALPLFLTQPAAAQQERYRERTVLDPNSNEWVHLAEPDMSDPLLAARAHLVHSEWRPARKLLEDWLKGHRDDERYYEGVFLYGESYFVGRDYWKAAEQYQIVMENASGELFYAAVRRTMDVARGFLAGQKRIVWKIFWLSAYDEGVTLLDRVYERVPGTSLGEDALKIKADYFFEKGQMQQAEDEYALLAREYPNGRFHRLALLQSAVSAQAAFAGVTHDDKPLLEATERYQQFQSVYPEYAERADVGARLAGIRETRGDKDIATAKWYEKSGHPAAAAYYYRVCIRDWPQTGAATQAADRLRVLGYPVPEVSTTPVEPAPVGPGAPGRAAAPAEGATSAGLPARSQEGSR